MIDLTDQTTLDSIWGRIQWDFLVQNPQLADWLEGSKLRATPDPARYQLLVADHADWIGAHAFSIRRALSVELNRPVVVEVIVAVSA